MAALESILRAHGRADPLMTSGLSESILVALEAEYERRLVE